MLNPANGMADLIICAHSLLQMHDGFRQISATLLLASKFYLSDQYESEKKMFGYIDQEPCENFNLV